VKKPLLNKERVKTKKIINSAPTHSQVKGVFSQDPFMRKISREAVCRQIPSKIEPPVISDRYEDLYPKGGLNTMAEEAKVKKAAFGGKVIKWSKVKDVKIGEIFGNKDCGMGDMIKVIWVFIKKHELNK